MPRNRSTANPPPQPLKHLASQPPQPQFRQLRGYAFDPSLATSLETALVSQITYKVPWEVDLQPGPIGEYLEVVDYDPPSQCFYAPIDLNAPQLLAQNGLAPSEGNPQFHQQMAYAVAMTTIDRFERSLGRKAFWSDRYIRKGAKTVVSEFVARLRIYPHALRTANAFYSRDRGALLFGYFPATEDRSSGHFPGGMVFTCLSHDVVAHEITHALLDGFHRHFMEPTNPDVLAFHEAFADIVALFQHFSFPEVLAHQIARTRGDLRSENLLAQLAAQVGHARGAHAALRDAIGKFDPSTGRWVPHIPDATELDHTTEVHARGAILVAAVFDAFLSIYHDRSRDLVRLATGGTGVLAAGDLHPDLVARLAAEASKAAGHVLNMCIRALDYCPPVDLTFGEYLRALITADIDLVPDDGHGYRIAFIEAFRRRGIYPRDVRTLSEETLCWSRPEETADLPPGETRLILSAFVEGIGLRQQVDRLRYLNGRRDIWNETRRIQAALHNSIANHINDAKLLQKLTGLALTGYEPPPNLKVSAIPGPAFSIKGFREADRLRSDGRMLNQVFLTILQKKRVTGSNGRPHVIRCGSTLVLDLETMRISYAIRKGINNPERIERAIQFQESPLASPSLAATYLGPPTEPFAALHHSGA